MPLKPYQESYISSLAEAIRSKLGTSSTYTIVEMQNAINQTVGPYYLNDFIQGNLTYYSNSTASRFGAYAFRGCDNLLGVSLPKLNYLYSGLFAFCSNLKSIDLPLCTGASGSTTIQGVFEGCTSLESVNLPLLTAIRSRMFSECSNLTNISVPEVKSVSDYAFNSCYNLQSINLPKCTTLNGYTFRYCTNLTNVSLPLCTSIFNYTFDKCSNLKSIYAPQCISIHCGAYLIVLPTKVLLL